ncbi:hypothetical protein A9Q99_11595 [Gammaproteobacteria bacterium 45_16_T64]|nr:hypothetical protein A9Q99_11595 [Gammaproteobacteria bacterium 45_16_T64]
MTTVRSLQKMISVRRAMTFLTVAALSCSLSGCGGGGGGGSDSGSGSGDPSGSAVIGENEYSANCAGCHGAEGQGGVGPALNDVAYTLEELIDTIDSTMPPSNPSACEGDCAEDVAEYIFAELMGEDIPVDDDEEPEPDVTASEYYEQHVETDIVQSKCALCHTNGGLAQSTDLLFTQGNNRASRNEAVLTNFFYSQDDAYTYILSKVRGGSAHGGGVQLACEDSGFSALENFLQLLMGDDAPSDELCAEAFWEGIEMADAQHTLRRASLIIAGRLPGDDELLLAETGESGLRQALRNIMEGENFHEFLLRGANDRLLTKAFVGDGDLKFGDRHDVHYPELSNRSYAANIAAMEGDENADGEFITLLNGFRFAGAMAPLKLIAHIVENDRPYTEILTADYTMVNPHTNTIFRSEVEFEDESDLLTFKPGLNRGQILEDSDAEVIREEKSLGPFVASHGGFIDYPHAGLLNDVALLNRYPSTDTNRNRGRSRWTYYQFLNFDIEKSAARSTDPEDLADTNNPTLNNPACTACHSTLDPIAGAFQNYGDKGHYRGSNGGLHSLPTSYTNDNDSLFESGDLWYREMLEPGFKGEIVETENSLQVLAQRITDDDRFANSVVSFWWQALMSGAIQDAPELVSDKTYQAQFVAYEAQQETIQTLAADFKSGASGDTVFNLKDLLVDMAMSPWFRAASSKVELSEEQDVSLAVAGIGRLLTPEELALKTQAVTGILWGETENENSIDPRYDNLKDKFSTYYGGIDSFGITTRATELTPLMSNVAMRQALAISCPAVVMDFQRNVGDRLLFDSIDLSITPMTEATVQFDVGEHGSPISYQSALVVNRVGDKKLRFTIDNPAGSGNQNNRRVYIDRVQLSGPTGAVILSLEAEDIVASGGTALDYDGSASGNVDTTDGYTTWSMNSGYIEIPVTIDQMGNYQVTAIAYSSPIEDGVNPLLSAQINSVEYSTQNMGAIRIKEQLKALHKRFLGEELSSTSDELEASLALFQQLWLQRWDSGDEFALSDAADESCEAPEGVVFSDDDLQDPQYLASTWSRMLLYFMTDYKYLHE